MERTARNPYAALHKTITAGQPFDSALVAIVARTAQDERALQDFARMQGYNHFDPDTGVMSIKAAD